MPAKYNLLPLTTFANQTQLDSIISLLLTHAKITRTQYSAIMAFCAGAYPCALEIDQRMAKQMLYINRNGEKYQLNNRSKITYIGKNT
jgi:hypothetical protein